MMEVKVTFINNSTVCFGIEDDDFESVCRQLIQGKFFMMPNAEPPTMIMTNKIMLVQALIGGVKHD